MTDKAIWIGGPKHGRLTEIPTDRDKFVIPDPYQLRHARYVREADYLFEPIEALGTRTIVCDVINLKLAPGRSIRGIRYPEISEDTARRFLADMVISAWEKKLADTRNR